MRRKTIYESNVGEVSPEHRCHAADYIGADQTRRRAWLPFSWIEETFIPPHNQIGVMLDFGLLRKAVEADQVIATVTCSVDTPAAQLFAPWYHRPDGSRTEYNDPEGKAWSHAEIAAPVPPEIEGFEHEIPYETLGKYWHEFQPNARVLTINVPEGKLVLDGNHRLASHLRQFPNMPVDVFHYHLEVPNEVGREVLPDIKYWS
jgi:hypothetical protein